VRHSPAGLDWGHGGSGPADAARSILWDHLGAEPPTETYQAFKWQVVAKMQDGAAVSGLDVARWRAHHELGRQTEVGRSVGASSIER